MSDKLLAAGIIYLTSHFIFNTVISALSGSGAGVGTLFKHQMAETSNNHTTQVTPSGFTFMIWNVIYLWLLAAYIYLTINLFRSSATGSGKRYSNPAIFGRYVTLALIFNAFFYTAWLFIWDNQYMTAAAAFLGCICLTNWIALITFSVSLWKNVVVLKTEAPADLILHRALIHNGLATYTTWTTIATLINTAIALIYDGKVDDRAASLLTLTVLSILLAIWMPLELIFWDNYFRYMITPLFVVLWALVGIYTKQSKDLDNIDGMVRQFTFILMLVTVGLIVIRAVFTIYRHFKRPLYIGLTTASSKKRDYGSVA